MRKCSFSGFANDNFHKFGGNFCDSVQSIHRSGRGNSVVYRNHDTCTARIFDQGLALHTVDVHDGLSLSNWACLVSNYGLAGFSY